MKATWLIFSCKRLIVSGTRLINTANQKSIRMLKAITCNSTTYSNDVLKQTSREIPHCFYNEYWVITVKSFI